MIKAQNTSYYRHTNCDLQSGQFHDTKDAKSLSTYMTARVSVRPIIDDC